MSVYIKPIIHSANGAATRLKDIPGRTLCVSMEIPWQVFQKQNNWTPDHLHFVTDMDKETVELLAETLPDCDVVVGLGGGSSCDMAKYIAWKRGCRMVLVPTIVSVDAPLTNTVAVRVDKKVQYVGDCYPQELIVDYTLIQSAPPEFNRAGACDIASIHTALFDWPLSHRNTGEAYYPEVAKQAEECLAELDRNAEEVYKVTPKGIDTIINLFQREVEFCAAIGSSRPEEGSEHIVAYNMEHITRRHFLHGDLVGLGIFCMSRLQENRPEYALDLMKRCGLRYTCPDASEAEVRLCLSTLKKFKEDAGLFYSVVDTAEIMESFINDCIRDLYA